MNENFTARAENSQVVGCTKTGEVPANWQICVVPNGTCRLIFAFPALACWATVYRPSGTAWEYLLVSVAPAFRRTSARRRSARLKAGATETFADRGFLAYSFGTCVRMDSAMGAKP